MAEKRGFVDNWEFKDKHVDPNIGSNNAKAFVSAARCILYAAPADKSTSADGTPAINTFTRIGTVQGFNWSENKQIEQFFELGSDLPYFVPGRTMGQISIAKMQLSGYDLLNTIYTSGVDAAEVTPDNWIRSLKDINIPLDLMFCFYGEGKDAGKYDVVYERLFKNCYIQSRSESVSAGQILVAENVNVMYEYVGAAKGKK
ncbi:MAG: hypothetical protein RR420_00755 [Anaerovoracaceae bacterium]